MYRVVESSVDRIMVQPPRVVDESIRRARWYPMCYIWYRTINVRNIAVVTIPYVQPLLP